MATSSRNKNGKATDHVVHLAVFGQAVCGIENPMVTTNGTTEQGICTCKKCIRRITERIAKGLAAELNMPYAYQDILYRIIHKIEIPVSPLRRTKE